jgi:hypothetical protein
MPGLRHAGSPVGTCEKLTRGRQDGILWPVVVAERLVTRRMGYINTQGHQETMDAIRAALRLDDPVLDDIIAGARRSGTPLQWSENRSRENA